MKSGLSTRVFWQIYHGNLLCGGHGSSVFARGQTRHHLVQWRGLGAVRRAGGKLLSDVIKRSSFGLRHLQVGEDEEEDEEDHENDEDVWAAKFLRKQGGADVGHGGSGASRLRGNSLRTSSLGKPRPTRKLAVQLEKPETAMAAGRGPWEKSSATMNHGMGPGPISKLATKPNTATMAR